MALDKHSPFISVPCKCPICARDARHRYVKSKLYTPTEIEPDQHVLTYKWESPRFEGIRPNFYHIWHCPFCMFSDEKEVFRGKDDSGGKLELIREKVLIASKAPYSFITRMGGVIDMEQEFITLDAALCAHLQAVFIQEMLSPNMRQWAKLGRFYLRTAWLYREKKTWNLPENDLPAGFNSYQDFFINLREEWPELPLSEEAAIEKAIHYYQGDLDRSKRIDDTRHEIQVLFLLVDLQRRLQQRDEAIKIVRNVFQMATQKRQSTRQTLDAAISRGKGTQQQIETMRSLIAWLNNAIERATVLSEEFNNEIFQEEYPKARERVLQLENVTVQAVLQFLREEGFHEVTARRVAAMFSKKILAQQTDATEPPQESSPTPPSDKGKSGGFLRNILGKFSGDNA